MPTEQNINQFFSQRMPYSVYCLTFTLQFKNGLAAGDGNFGNEMLLARNGKGELVLRGTSLAGVLRHSYEKQYGEDDTTLFFGTSAENNHNDVSEEIGTESPLIVSDIVLNVNKNMEYRRTHHLRNRHTGSVVENGLYSIEIAPPETTAQVTLWFNETKQCNESAKVFLQRLAELIRNGLIFGGNSNRGVGLATANEFVYKKYSLSEKEQYAEYLNDFYAWRKDGTNSVANSEKLTPENDSDTNNLTIKFTLQIPRGQDLLIAEGNEMSPHKIKAADGNEYYLLPGSTLRGLFRSWITRLAARDEKARKEGKTVSDSVEHYEEQQRNIKGSEIGWMFNEKLDVSEIDKKYPVESLFGSLHQSGRIHFTDALCPVDKATLQHRKHVALDAISGGAIEHLLFDNDVLTQGAFDVTIIVRDVKNYEAEWLAKTLKALHIGLLRVGSSKAAGRLELVDKPQSVGSFADIFDTIKL
ncbi:MAG: RAMP superfamily CRISPR-associated protein [Planctomycetaceae bacterium]|jgi:CRISPR/Cas system CSM-associated protein Csm3 (group 7 of RAMP superfamily)|nr:RAMP superfamily CRISPR-associated protein [Planctomycetaceae bacterium]